VQKVFKYFDIKKLLDPPSLLSNMYRGFFTEGRESDHIPPTGTEVKNGGAVPPLLVRVPGYRSRDPGSIPGATSFLRNCVFGTGSTQLREHN
jgi:hypothetical protein